MTPLSPYLDDGPSLSILVEEQLVAARMDGDWDAVLQLARAVRAATDPLRALAALQQCAGVLLAAASGGVLGSERDRVLGTVLELLLDRLEQDPHEPELLELLGRTLLLAGAREEARDAFHAIGTLEEDHPRLLEHLDACRRPGADGPTVVGPAAALVDSRARARVRALLERAVELPARTISLCMIVRDEEAMLPGCLASVASVVDEIIVVDTGSTDRTREIAAAAGAVVIERPWDGSFSAARNVAIDAATSDWVLWLDADEHLVSEADARLLPELARRTWVEGFHVVETHLTGEGEQGSSAVHAPLRMIRNRPHYRWSGIVHEQVAHTLPTWMPGRIRHSTVRVVHYGYVSSIVNERDKRRRNLELLHRQLEHDRSAFTCFNVGSEHAAMGEFGAALEWFEEALDGAQRQPGWQESGFATLLVQRTVTARRAVGDLHGAVELATRALAWWPDYTDLVYELAAAYAELGQDAEARRSIERALELGEAPAPYVAVPGKGSHRARALLAALLRRSNDLQGARRELVAALQLQPHDVDTATELVEVLLELEEGPDAALAELHEALGGADATPLATDLAVGALLQDRGHRTAAGECYARVLDARPQHPGALAALAELELADGNLMAAWETGLALDPLDAGAAIGARSAFLAAAALGDPALVAEPAARIADSELLSAAERAVYAAWSRILDPAGSEVHDLIPTDSVAVDTVLSNLEALARLEATDAFEQLHALVPRVLPIERERRLTLAELYLRLRFADLAAEELLAVAQSEGVDAGILTLLGKVATIKQQWEDAEVFVTEALALDPARDDARRLLQLLRSRPTA